MSQSVGYRTRLRIRIGKGLTTDNTSLKAAFDGRDVIVQSATPDQPLKEASWLVMSVRGFTTQGEASDYGEDLRRAANIAGLCTLVGVDARAMGDDRTTTIFSALGDEWLRSRGILQPHEKTVPDIHGISVFPDDENIKVIAAQGSGRVTHDPQEFISAIEQAATTGVSRDVDQAIRVLNLAHISDNPLATVVLAISAIEALAVKNEGWTTTQEDMIAQTTTWVHRQFGGSDAVLEVTEAIHRMHRQSLRQQSKRLLTNHNLQDRWLEWDDVYGRRSRLFHGGAMREDKFVVELANDAMKVCGAIVLSIAKQQGAVLPTAAKQRFGVH